jgi:hypothetical protein
MKNRFLVLLIACLWCWVPLAQLRALPLTVFLGGSPPAASGPIAFVGVQVNAFSTTRSPSVISPTCSTNDILLAVICADGAASFDGSPPTGWTLLHQETDGGADQTSAVFWARVDGTNVLSGETKTWTTIMAANEIGLSAVIAFSGCKTSGSPISAASPAPTPGGSATAQDGPSVTPTVDNCMIVGIRTIDPGASTRTFTWDAPFTMRLGFSTTPSGVSGTTAGIYIASYLQGTAAAISPAGDFDAVETATRFTYALEP